MSYAESGHTAHGTLGDVIDGPEAAKSGSKETRPRFSYKRAILAILIPLPVAAAVVYFGTHILRDYGWSLFVGLPFVLPMLSVVIYGFGREVTRWDCFWIAVLWMLLAIVLLVATAFEGLICIIMMLPLAVPIVVLGTWRLFHPRTWTRTTPRSRQARDCPVRPAADDGGRRTCHEA